MVVATGIGEKAGQRLAMTFGSAVECEEWVRDNGNLMTGPRWSLSIEAPLVVR